MCDFVEIWDLRNKLIYDGYYNLTSEEEIDSCKFQHKIVELAKEYYDYKEPAPTQMNFLQPTLDWLNCMTLQERIDEINEILIDWDGHRTIRGLGKLVDEVKGYLNYPISRSNESLKREIDFWHYNSIENFVSSKAFLEDIALIAKGREYHKLFMSKDYHFLKNWAQENGFKIQVCYIHKFFDAMDLIIKGVNNENDTIQKESESN